MNSPNQLPQSFVPLNQKFNALGSSANKVTIKVGNSFSLSPMHERFRIFKETYNVTREELKDKIRLTRDVVANRILYAYYNKYYTLEIKRWGNKNPELLPSLLLNNVDIIDRVGVEAKSTAWRAITFLCKIDLGEGRGVLMKKIFHGKYKDYTILINPWILTGQQIDDWGTNSEKTWQNSQNFQPENQPPLSPLVANCNVPITKGTILKNKTTTNACGKVENVQVVQEHEKTGTNEESANFITNPYLKTYLQGQQGTNTANVAGSEQKNKEGRSEQIKAKYFGDPTITTTKNTENHVENSVEKELFNQIKQKSYELTLDFYNYSMPILYPRHKNTSKTQTRLILNTIWKCWFKPFVNNPNCSIQFLQSMYADLQELVVMTQHELDTRPDSFIHANPAVFFDTDFKHGLVRAAIHFKKRKINRDNAILRKAQKSVSSGSIPKGIKSIKSIIDLVAYWKMHIANCCTNKELMLRAFNVYLTNHKNVSNGLKSP